MPPQRTSTTPNHSHPQAAWFVGAFVAVLVVGILIGVGLAHSNSDFVCSQGYSDSQQGACTGGSWSGWTIINGTAQRTYTGMRSVVTYTGSVGKLSCSHPANTTIAQSSGQITTAYAACQIIQTGVSATGSATTSTSSIIVTSQTEKTGFVSASSQVTGTYADYQKMIDTSLATSSIEVAPALVKVGYTTQVIWNSSHVVSCQVAGTNGDTWAGGSSSAKGETSSPIQGLTVYTLTCKTALGTTLTSSATVKIVPAFHEQ